MGTSLNQPFASPAIKVAAALAISEPDANISTGLTGAAVEERRASSGFNEVADKKTHPLLIFLGKFWGISAWMLELIMVLSALLGNYADLAVVSTLLVINAVLGFAQERRAAGVIETLRRRLQVSARVLRDSSWQVVPARELVPGDIVRLRSGDIVPADIKLLAETLSVDQSALTGESKESDKSPGDAVSSGSIVRRGEGTGVVVLSQEKTAMWELGRGVVRVPSTGQPGVGS